LVNVFKYGIEKTEAYNKLSEAEKESYNWGEPIATYVEFWGTTKDGKKLGKVWTNPNYPAVKLYENVPMTGVLGSDGGAKFQSFEILAAKDGYSEGTLRVSDWIAPTSVADLTTGNPVAGFSGIPMYNSEALVKDTARWAAAKGTWEFVYIAGMLTFEPGFTPQDKSTSAVDAETRKSVVTLTAFKYCGEKLEDSISTINGDIDVLQAEVDTITLVTEPIKTVSAEKTVTYNGGKTIVGTAVEAAVSGAATGDVTVTLEGKDFELLSFYQKYANGQMEIIYPEIAKTAGADGNSIYTLTADYGEAVSGITSSLVWEINCKVK
jgi:hypothetical protein